MPLKKSVLRKSSWRRWPLNQQVDRFVTPVLTDNPALGALAGANDMPASDSLEIYLQHAKRVKSRRFCRIDTLFIRPGGGPEGAAKLSHKKILTFFH